MTLSGDPVLSVELFQTIIDHLAEQPSLHERDAMAINERLANLVQCALVCKTFARTCRRHIFSHIHSVALSGHEGHQLRLISFINHATAHPDVLPLVRMLSLDAGSEEDEDEEEPRMNNDELEHILSVLSSFPNLQYLELDSWDYDPHSSGDRFVRARLLDAYLEQGTLRTLFIDKLPLGFPTARIIGAPGLTSWRFRYPDGANLAITMDGDLTSTLERIQVDHHFIQSFPIDFLDHCPRLRKLVLPDSISFTTNSTPTHAFDSSTLKSLTVRQITVFKEFCQSRQRHRDGRKLFQNLEELNLDLIDVPNIETTKELLKEMPSLRILKVRVYLQVPTFDLLDIGIDQRFLDGSLKNLADLHLTFTALPEVEGYETTLASMESVINAASGRNVLERVHIVLSFGDLPAELVSAISEVPFPALETMGDSLGDKTKFPALWDLELNLSFTTPSESFGHEYSSYSRISIRNGVPMLLGRH